MLYSHLPDRSIFVLSGDDTIAFLQGLITQDATRLQQGEALYALLLSPQGKFLHDFFLIPHAGKILLDTDASNAAELIARLKKYILRSKVVIEKTSMQVAALFSTSGVAPSAGAQALVITDPRLAALGLRVYSDTLQTFDCAAADYEAHRIQLAVPEGIRDLQFDTSLPMEFGLDKLHAISFSKGCYVGQEVTARIKYRGQLRKILVQVQSAQPLPASGTMIMSQDKEVGQLFSTYDNYGIALLRSEVTQQENVALVAAGAPLTYNVPVWNQ